MKKYEMMMTWKDQANITDITVKRNAHIKMQDSDIYAITLSLISAYQNFLKPSRQDSALSVVHLLYSENVETNIV